MSSEPHEIVIIKRHGGGHEEEHHGGVWKIAFADFMTAMMAFFLVMWLISANDKTKAVIARYFNPVQLVDSTPQPKGLEDPKEGSPSVMPKAAAPAPEPKDLKPDSKAEEAKGDGKGEGKGEAKGEAKAGDAKAAEAKTDGKPEGKATESKAAPSAKEANAAKSASSTPAEALSAEKRDEAALFRDPYAVLAEIAGKNLAPPPRDLSKAATDGAKGGAGAIGRRGGQAYRDPFEPLPVKGGPALESFAQETATDAQNAAPPPPPPPAAATGGAPASQPGPSTSAAGPVPKTPDASPAPLAAQIEAAVHDVAATAPAGGPRLDIHRTGEGTVIDLTDGANFAMFASASARPSPTMVTLLEKIGRLLKGEKGLVTIRGFTDGRPFRSDTYDNWRLSSARAHMAHYMLVRGGLDEQRIERIEGYADHELKNPKDPNAPENRRIEILLRNPGP